MDRIKVCVRFRPLNNRERGTGSKKLWKRLTENTVKIEKPFQRRGSKTSFTRNTINPSRSYLVNPSRSDRVNPSRSDRVNPSRSNYIKLKQLFTFDEVFDEECTQEQVFNNTCKDMIDDVISGYNCTVMAYGQTGTGKTYTMSGTKDEPGIIPQVVQGIFSRVEGKTVEISVSYVEIYMEQIQDLLDPKLTKLKIREAGKGVYIEGCTSKTVTNWSEMEKIIEKGYNNRTVAETQMNSKSSRSHAVFIMSVKQIDNSDHSVTCANLFLVDLAGSEKIIKTGATGKRLKEANHVNTSLSTISLVIRSLTSKDSQHIPYRNSILTRLLSDSLGGNSKTTLLMNCSPSKDSLEETYATLEFGKRAKLIENVPKKNKNVSIKAYKAMVKDLRNQVKDLQLKVHDMEQHNGDDVTPSFHTMLEAPSSETQTDSEAEIMRWENEESPVMERRDSQLFEDGIILKIDPPKSPGWLEHHARVGETLDNELMFSLEDLVVEEGATDFNVNRDLFVFKNSNLVVWNEFGTTITFEEI